MVADGTDESEFDESESDHNPIPNPDTSVGDKKEDLKFNIPT